MKEHTISKLVLIIVGILFASIHINGNKKVLNIINEENQIERDYLESANDNWEPELTRSVGDEPHSVFVGDANNDGYNDIVTSNVNDDDVSILLWNPISSDWYAQFTKPVGDGPDEVFIGDANNDRYNDIVTVNMFSDDVSILLWNPISGDWDPQITKAVGDWPSGLFIGDANNDGYNDIINTNSQLDDTVSILLWNPASGDWDPQITKSVGNGPSSSFIGDANNDGYNDIVTANFYDDDVSILLWNPISGDWDAQFTKTVGDTPTSVFIGDANNDGYNDIAAASFGYDYVSILLWNPISGDWDEQLKGPVGDQPVCVFIGDANNDGYNDIVSANQWDDTASVILWNPISGDWDAQFTKPVGEHPYSVSIGDANNDGYNDIVTANIVDDDISIYLWRYVTPSIVLQTPENKVYKAPMSGYYPATYGFEKSEIGTVPKGWLNTSESGCSVEVIEEVGNHRNVVELYDHSNTTRSHIFNSFSLKSHGTVEFYMRATSVGWFSEVYLSKEGTHLFRVLFGGHYLRIFNNTQIVNLLNVSTHQWYHIRVDFRCRAAPEYMGLNEKRFKIHVNGQEFGPYIIYNDRSHAGVNRMNVWTGEYQHDYRLYVDDIGYSWDPNYDIGDNLNEGLLLSFDKNYPFNWIGYSIDGLASKAILGNVSIPFPEDGPHSILVFGKDSIGNLYQSDPRNFSVDTQIPEFIQVEIIYQFYSLDHFNITLFVSDEYEKGLGTANIKMWWDGNNVSDDVRNLGDGYYFISLEPITIPPGEDPILLNMTISATGYKDEYFEAYITIDPDTLDKNLGKSPPDVLLLILIIAITSIIGGIGVAVITVFLLRKKSRLNLIL